MPTPDVIEGLASRNRMLAGLVAALVIIFAGAVTLSNRSRAAALQTWEIERAALAARTDSALAFNQAALAAIAGELDGLAQALRESEARVRQLQADLTAMASSERPDPESLATLRAQIDEATARMSGQRRAASLDAVGITARVRPAVVMIYTEFVDGTRSVATGFAVSSDGRVVTNRHVVAGETGRSRASRVGIQFSGSTQVWPADVMAIGEGVDLALLQTRNLVGGNPEVGVLNPRADTLGTGTPVLLIGFPDTKLSSEGATAPRAIATAGTSLGLRNGRLEVDGWGAAGGSGSPVLDGTGAVVGVLFGAAGGDGDRHLVAVPVSQLRAFLAAN
jgi:S1-C subfamily serine protease